MGNAKIYSSNHITHFTYNLESLYNEYLNLNQQVNLLSTQLSNHDEKFNTEFQNYWKIIEHCQGNIGTKFQNLNINNKINKRNKRGLIDGLGAIIKSITGNLDNSDAQRYDNLISQLKQNQNSLKQNIVENFNTNTEIIEQFNKTIEDIKHNEITLKSKITEIQSLLNKDADSIDHLFVKDLMNQIILLYSIVQNTLTNIETSLSFCSIGILHQNIVSNSQLKKIFQIINKNKKYYFPEKLQFNDMQKLIQTYCKLNKYEIDYLIIIPMYFNKELELLQITPVPTIQESKAVTIFQSEHMILKESNKLYSLSTPCKLVSKQYYCSHINNLLINQNTCDFQIIFNKNPKDCNYILLTDSLNTVLEITNTNQFVLYYNNNTKINIKCNNQNEEYKYLKGVYLLENNECILNNEKLINNMDQAQPIIISNYKFNISKTQKVDSYIDLINIKEMKFNRHALKPIQEIEIPSINNHNVIMYVIVAAILIVITVILFRKKLNFKKRNQAVIIPMSDLNLPGDARL